MVEIDIQNLSFHYGKSKVFSGISFSAERGELVSLVGPNGTGKTTLMKCINCLHKQSSGNVLFEGRDVSKMRKSELAKYIAYVPQSGNVNFPIPVLDAVLLGRRPHMGWKVTQKDLDMTFDVMCKMGIDNLAEKTLDCLSGGERQKVMIAKAIVQEPTVLLLDEPTTYLDMGYQMKIMDMIHSLVKEKNICAIMTTHELNYALQFSDKIAIMKDSKLVACGETSIVTSDVIRKVYDINSVIREEQGRPYIIPISSLKKEGSNA